MLEYKIETLVQLYDSLNTQIDKTQEQLNEIAKVIAKPIDAEAYQKLNDFRTVMETRFENLVDMRNSVEIVLGKMLAHEAAEVEENK